MGSLVISEPNFAEKMVVCSKNQQLILCQIFPVIRKVRDHNKGKNGKGLHPRSNVFGKKTLGSQHI